MTTNDNRTIMEDYFRSLHPQLSDEPNHPLLLDAKDDARLKARAEKYGFDYDQLKRDFLVSHQVISPRPHAESLRLMKEHAVPINGLSNYFEGYVDGVIGQFEADKGRRTPVVT